MYNILIFGFDKNIANIEQEFSVYPCKILHIFDAEDFYATAFSRIFDLWLLDGTHQQMSALSLSDVIASHQTPLIFVHGVAEIQSITDTIDRIKYFNDSSYASCLKKFSELMNNYEEQDKEKYLAGYVNANPGLEAIVTKSPLMDKLRNLIKDVAPTDSPVLLIGETGTGKELIARIFHNESRRKSGPFMAVKCGALPDTLLESELFGFEKGAFTGASNRRQGKIEHASGGTLFLDELEAMSQAMQIRLLRVLQEKTLQRLGGNTEISTDFRVIAATNTEPLELLNSGQLRADLYYRLSVFQIGLPPLRERIEDIPLLTQHFINRKKRNGRDFIKGIDSQAMNILLSVPWFGNVRELQNVVERAVMLATEPMISADLIQIPAIPLPETLVDVTDFSENAFRPGTTLKTYKNLLNQSAERKYLVELLEYTSGRIGEAAQLADLTPRALYNKMKIHGLKKEDFKKSEK